MNKKPNVMKTLLSLALVKKIVKIQQSLLLDNNLGFGTAIPISSIIFSGQLRILENTLALHIKEGFVRDSCGKV